MAEPPVYFAFTGGRQIGPLQFAEMADLAARGVLSPDDLAWKSGTPEWVPAQQLLAFTKRKSSASREAFGSPADASRPPEDPPAAVPAPRTGPGPKAVPGDRAAPSTPAPAADAGPEQWKRVSLSRASDDPGLSVAASAAEGETDGETGAGATPEPTWRRVSASFSLSRLGDAAILGSPVTWTLVFFGLGPLALAAVIEDPVLRIRLFHFGCGSLWMAFFYVAFRPEADVTRATLALFFGAALFGVLYFGLLRRLPPVSTLAPFAEPARHVGWRLLSALGGVALVQELGKAAILAVAGRVGSGEKNGRLGFFYGLVVGTSFGLFASAFEARGIPAVENALLRGAESPSTALYSWFVASVVAAASRPFLHGLWTAVLGFFLVSAVSGSRRPGRRVALGLAVPIGLHGLYNAFSSGVTAVLAVAVAAVSLGVFLQVWRAAEEEPAVSPPAY
ncbi:MAG TPA: GYF domain-containing protein [Thermoanaerobaculia bacterium]|nr:GYF domain-containing protein [Thermoanaerobaculia bacterium]